jgi:hypothetical protein
MPLLDTTCLFLYRVPTAFLALVHRLHKLDDALVIEASHWSIRPMHNCFLSILLPVSILGTHLTYICLYQK